jgi:hypothetical protein
MADIIENNSPMQEAPLVNTNEPIVEQPMVEPEGGEGDPVKKGATSTTKDKTPKYDLDNGQLNTTANETAGKLAEFAGMVFKTTGVAPTYKGKTITDMSSIVKIMNDGKAGQEIYKQALAALESPDLDEDSIASLYTKVYEIESGFNRTAAIKQQITKGQRLAATFLDAKRKGGSSRYSLLVNDNGDFVSKEEYKRKVERYYADQRALFLKNNPRESTFDSRGNPTYWIRTDMPNVMSGARLVGLIDPKTKQTVTLDSRPKLNGTTEGWDLSFSMSMVADSKAMQNRIDSYDDDVLKIKEEYNLNGEIPAIKILEQGVYKQGGAEGNSGLSSSFSFDGDDFLNRDDKGNILKIEDAGSKDKNANIFKKDFKNLYNLVDKTKSMEGAIIVSGSPEDYPSGVPSKTDDKVKATLNQFNTDLDEHIKSFFAHSKKLTPTKLKGRPAGNVSFQPIASGNENYQAYHITFSEGYSNKYAESEKKQKEHPEYKKGLTIFVPKEKAGETRIGAASLRGTNISNTEAAINMSPDNTYRFSIPGGGAIEASKIGDSVYTITGNNVVYNLQNGKYDTLPINAMKYEVGASMAVDMDTYIKRHVDTMIMNKVNNVIKSNHHKSKNGVTDPNLLKRN